VNVESAVRRVLAIVAASRRDEHQHDAAFGNRLTVVLDVAGDITSYVWGRWLEANHFLYRLGNQRRNAAAIPSPMRANM
jgi:hypothetical protein